MHDLGYVDGHGAFFTMKLINGKPLIDIQDKTMTMVQRRRRARAVR